MAIGVIRLEGNSVAETLLPTHLQAVVGAVGSRTEREDIPKARISRATERVTLKAAIAEKLITIGVIRVETMRCSRTNILYRHTPIIAELTFNFRAPLVN